MAGHSPEELKAAAQEHMMNIFKSGQSYTIGSRKLTRVNFKDLADYLAATSDVDPSGDDGLLGNTYVAEFEPR